MPPAVSPANGRHTFRTECPPEERGLNKAILMLTGLVVAVLLQAGCSTADVLGSHVLKNILEPDPTVVVASVTVDKDVNPDSRGRPSPIKARFYLLKSAAVFQGTGFYELKEQDRELLGDDLKYRDEKVFKPGAVESIELRLPAEDSPEDERLFLAVVAGYWDLDNADWRAVKEIEVQETTEVAIKFGRSAVSIRDIED